ncbi:MAG: glycosyltransferase [Gemmatimonadetes bacterium]|nr:glycosyltransferase [Gemmatimonadota bacterium]MBI3569147.1 glycosyltransferase [Gemmatimonadota bacterium]
MTITASVSDRIFLSDATLRASPLDLGQTTFPPPLRPDARLGVLDITEFYGDTTGGIRTYLREKAQYVEAHPAYRQVLVLPGSRDALSATEGVRCYRLRGPRVPKQAPYRFMLATRTNRRIVLHERPDVIEVGSPGLVPWIARLASRGLDIPAVAFYHSNFPRVFTPFPETAGGARRAIADLAWRYARAIDKHFAHTIACSEFAAADLRRAGVERVTRIPLGVDLAHYHPMRRARRDDVRARYALTAGPLAGFVGRFAVEKELDVLLDAWPRVHARTGAELVLIGAGPLQPRLEARLRDMPYARILPYETDRGRLADLLAALDICVAPCSVETFGLSALEALSSGTPVLSADRGGISEQVETSGAGRRFASGSAASLAEEAVALLAADLGALGALGRRYAEDDHSWESVFDRVFALYARVTGA